MGAYKKSVFMRDSGVISINIGDVHYLQLGREDAKELAEMILKVVYAPESVDERQAQARIMPSKDQTGIWFYSADQTIDERILQEIVLKADRMEDDMVNEGGHPNRKEIMEFMEEREEND